MDADESKPSKTLRGMLNANSCFIASEEFRNFLFRTPEGDLAVIEDIPWDGRRVVAYKIDRTKESSSRLTLLTLELEDVLDFVPIYNFRYKCLYSDLCEEPSDAVRT